MSDGTDMDETRNFSRGRWRQKERVRATRKASSIPPGPRHDDENDSEEEYYFVDSDSSSDYYDMEEEENYMYFREDAADPIYRKAHKDPNKLWCEVCGQTFANVKHFVAHHRRHVAPELFRCPTCALGFLDLMECCEHEKYEHGKEVLEMSSKSLLESPVDSSPMTKKPVESSLESKKSGEHHDAAAEGEEDITKGTDPETKKEAAEERTLTSTTLRPYQGPPIDCMKRAIMLEKSHGIRDRPIVHNFNFLLSQARKRQRERRHSFRHIFKK